MTRSVKQLMAIGLVGLSLTGCADNTPPPPDAPIPRARGEAMHQTDAPKRDARPGEDDERAGDLPPPPFNDVPLVSQDTPEQRAFVEAYNAVGRPRIAVFVNRTLDGTLLPVSDEDAHASIDRSRNKGEVSVETRDRRNTDTHYSSGAEPTDRNQDYLRPGQYDDVATRQIDYEAIETVLTDWIAAGGRVEIISPIVARQRLSNEQVNDLQSGQPRAMGEVERQLQADVLVHVTAHPTRQTQRGVEVRLVAEAINVRGGQSVGRAVVDVPPPLDKAKINKFTRFLARVLMDRMIGTWENMPAPADDRDRTGAGGGPAAFPGPTTTTTTTTPTKDQ